MDAADGIIDLDRLPPRALLCDDDAVLRSVVGSMLVDGGWEIVAGCSSAIDAIADAAHHAPDLIVLDVGLPGLNGLEAIPHLLAAAPNTAIILLTAFAQDPDVLTAMGVVAVVDKASLWDLEIVAARVLEDRTTPVAAAASTSTETESERV